MEIREDLQKQSEEPLGHNSPIPFPRREIGMLDNAGYLHDQYTSLLVIGGQKRDISTRS